MREIIVTHLQIVIKLQFKAGNWKLLRSEQGARNYKVPLVRTSWNGYVQGEQVAQPARCESQASLATEAGTYQSTKTSSRCGYQNNRYTFPRVEPTKSPTVLPDVILNYTGIILMFCLCNSSNLYIDTNWGASFPLVRNPVLKGRKSELSMTQMRIYSY